MKPHTNKVVALHPAHARNFREYENAADRQARLTRFADYLRTFAGQIERDELAKDPHALLLAVIHADGPEVSWIGVKDWNELREVSMELDDKYRDARGAALGLKPGQSTVQRVRQSRRDSDLASQVYLDAHPWLCDHCTRRFKTEAGTKIHERACNRRRRTRAGLL